MKVTTSKLWHRMRFTLKNAGALMDKGEPETANQKPLVLLVEDDLLVQKVHLLKLKYLGCRVDLAPTGIRALELYSSKYQLILLDCGLPDISGIEVGKKIRDMEEKNNLEPVPIIMITAFAPTVELHAQCIEAGIDKLLMKPITDESVWTHLVKICKNTYIV